MEISFNQVDVAKLSLGPDDVLIVSVKGNKGDMSGPGLEFFANNLRETFDQNKVVVLGLGKDNEVNFTVVKEKSSNQSYCIDCSCGKKESTEETQSELIGQVSMGLPGVFNTIK